MRLRATEQSSFLIISAYTDLVLPLIKKAPDSLDVPNAAGNTCRQLLQQYKYTVNCDIEVGRLKTLLNLTNIFNIYHDTLSCDYKIFIESSPWKSRRCFPDFSLIIYYTCFLQVHVVHFYGFYEIFQHF